MLCVVPFANAHGFGPFEVGNQYPLALYHESFRPTTPETIDVGTLVIRPSLAWSNTLTARRGKYIVDAESRVTTLSLAYAPVERLQLELDLPFVWRGRGILDSPIDTWHQWFDLPRGDRDKFPDQQFEINGRNQRGQRFRAERRGTHFGDISLGAKYQFSDAAVLGRVRLPTAADGIGQDSIDLLGGVVGMTSWDDIFLYAGAAYTFFADQNFGALTFRQHHVAGFTTLEWRINEALAVSLGVLGGSNLIDNVTGFPDHSLYIDVGAKWRWKQIWWEFMLRENPSPRKGTTDVTFFLSAAIPISLSSR